MFIVQNKIDDKKTVKLNKSAGFTLLEILIALFVFAILSTMLTAALHRVINIESSVTRHATALRSLQFALIRIANDVEQAGARPVLTASGKEAPAFSGTAQGFALTRIGTNPERVSYLLMDNALYRMSSSVLDAAPDTTPHKRRVLSPVKTVFFQYADAKGHLQTTWPSEGQSSAQLPTAVKVRINLPEWGEITQVYVISATQANNDAPPTTQP